MSLAATHGTCRIRASRDGLLAGGLSNPGFQGPECLLIAPAPAHEKVEEFVCMAVDLLKLANGIELLSHDFAGAVKRHVFGHSDFEGFETFGNSRFGQPQASSNFRTGQTLPK